MSRSLRRDKIKYYRLTHPQEMTRYLEKTILNLKEFFSSTILCNQKSKKLSDHYPIANPNAIETERITDRLSKNKSSNIKNSPSNFKAFLNVFFITLCLIFLSKTIQQDGLIVSKPVLNRGGKKVKSVLIKKMHLLFIKFIKVVIL